MITVNKIGNYYGSLELDSDGDKFYLRMGCAVGSGDWMEIKKTLYDELVSFNNCKHKYNSETGKEERVE